MSAVGPSLWQLPHALGNTMPDAHSLNPFMVSLKERRVSLGVCWVLAIFQVLGTRNLVVLEDGLRNILVF